MSGGGTSQEVAEMASDDLLDVDADGMVGKNKGNPIAVAGEKRGGKDGDGSDLVEALSTMVLRNLQLKKKVDISEASLLNTYMANDWVLPLLQKAAFQSGAGVPNLGTGQDAQPSRCLPFAAENS
eukprot:g29432.t1